MSAESARFIVVWDNLSPLQRRALSAAANDDTVRIMFHFFIFSLLVVECATFQSGQFRTFPVTESNT